MTSADGVARGPLSRAQVSPALFAALLERYGVHADNAVDLGGSSNLNLLVKDGEKRCVVRVYRPWVTAARLRDMQRVRQHLAAGGLPCALPIPTRDGASWIEVDLRLVEVEPYVEHDAKMDTWERLEAGLPTLGRLHTLLRGFEASEDGQYAPATNNIEPEDVLTGTRRGLARLRAWQPTPDELTLGAKAEELAQLVDQAQRDFAGMPRQLVHGDYWDNNIFFREGHIVLVADFDFMGERARIDDLALTLYYTNSTFTDDQTSDERIQKLLRLVDAYDSGLDERLTRHERAALPVALARAPLAFIAMIAAVDSQAGARQLAAEMTGDICWALAIAQDFGKWQAAFTRQMS